MTVARPRRGASVVEESRSVTVASALLARLPRVQRTEPFVIAEIPWLDLTDNTLTPGGMGALTCTTVAGAGPRFLTVMIIVSSVPGAQTSGDRFTSMVRS